MPQKLQNIIKLASQTAHQVTSGPRQWASFLHTAARLYKYSFHDQLLIYAQRPDAKACATIEVWNRRMNRWIKRGSTGIALIDQMDSSKKPRLKYVFDITDTHEGKNAREPQIWELRPELLRSERNVSIKDQ